MDVLVPGQLAELLDARLHIVAGHALALHDALQIHHVLHLLIALDHAIRDADAEVALSLHDGDPELALQLHFSLAAPDGAHGGSGVAFGEDVGDLV